MTEQKLICCQFPINRFLTQDLGQGPLGASTRVAVMTAIAPLAVHVHTIEGMANLDTHGAVHIAPHGHDLHEDVPTAILVDMTVVPLEDGVHEAENVRLRKTRSPKSS